MQVRKNQISVPYYMTSCYMDQREAYEWTKEDLLDFSSGEEAKKLEDSLNWIPGTMTVLYRAFQRGLTRDRCWCTSKSLSSREKQAVALASTFFKRGVGFLSSKETTTQQSGGSYPVIFEKQGFFEDSICLDEPMFTLIDRNVYQTHPYLESYQNKYILDFTEEDKLLASVSSILKIWKMNAFHLKTWLVIGGGVLSDVVGFAASLCSASLIIVPTTLLSMVDASVGGKTGVNFPPYGKNQIGTFYFPKKVFISSHWLSSLAKRHLFSGISESLKHAMIALNFDLVKTISQISRDENFAKISSYLPEILSVKINIISQDPLEQDRRKQLNLGHTLAHALEFVSHENAKKSSGQILLHGEAVAVGLCFIAILSQMLGFLNKDHFIFFIQQLLYSRCLSTKPMLQSKLMETSLHSEEFITKLFTVVAHDKKSQQKGVYWVMMSSKTQLSSPSSEWLKKITLDEFQIAWLKTLQYLPS